MPLDSLMGYREESNDEAFKRRCIGWELTFLFWPRRCYYTKKLLWLKLAYRGTSMLTGPGEPIFEYRWCEKQEYLFLKIKGIV
jgi:hypothetical protein